MQDILLLTTAPTNRIQQATQSTPTFSPPSPRVSGQIAGDRVTLSGTQHSQQSGYPTPS